MVGLVNHLPIQPRRRRDRGIRSRDLTSPDADSAFLHRILFGLIAATLVSGVLTAALSTQARQVEPLIAVARAP